MDPQEGTPVSDLDEFADNIVHQVGGDDESELNQLLGSVVRRAYGGNQLAFSIDLVTLVEGHACARSESKLTCEYLHQKIQEWAEKKLRAKDCTPFISVRGNHSEETSIH